MCHIQESAGGISLDPHVPRLGEAGQRAKSAGTSNLGLVVFVCGEVGDATDGIALDFDIGREHLALERAKAAQLDDQNLVRS